VTSAASVRGDERLRLFCGLRLPAGVLDRIGAWQTEQLRDGRIVPREHLHVTLAFLGGRPAAELPAITAALDTAVEGGSPLLPPRRQGADPPAERVVRQQQIE